MKGNQVDSDRAFAITVCFTFRESIRPVRQQERRPDFNLESPKVKSGRRPQQPIGARATESGRARSFTYSLSLCRQAITRDSKRIILSNRCVQPLQYLHLRKDPSITNMSRLFISVEVLGNPPKKSEPLKLAKKRIASDSHSRWMNMSRALIPDNVRDHRADGR